MKGPCRDFMAGVLYPIKLEIVMFCLKLVLMERRELSSVTLAFCLYVKLPEAVVKHLVAAKSSACYRGALFLCNLYLWISWLNVKKAI